MSRNAGELATGADAKSSAAQFIITNQIAKGSCTLRFKNKDLCRIRTITTFLSLTDDKTRWKKQIQKASHFCAKLSKEFLENGYTVQSVRIVTNPFGEYLNIESLESAREDLAYLSSLLNASDLSGIRIRFAIGEARTQNEIRLLPELVKEFGDLCNVCVNVDPDDYGILNNTLITYAAEAVTKISQITPRGEGNFNFTVNFNCDPLIPYFPAGDHRKEQHSYHRDKKWANRHISKFLGL